MDHGLNFQVSLEVERNELRYSPKWMGLIHYVHRLEHFEEFTQKSWMSKKKHILLQVTCFGCNGSTDSSMLNFNELQGFKHFQTTNDETKVVACDTMHPACSEENLIMFCCRLVRLGWTGTGDGPAWLAESEHRKFVGEPHTKSRFASLTLPLVNLETGVFVVSRIHPFFAKVLAKFAPSQFCRCNRKN